MAITAANIITALNEELQISENTSPSARMTRVIRNALRFLSGLGRWSCLYTSASAAVIAGTEYINWPDNFRLLDEIKLNDGTYDYEPLEDLEGGYRQWLKNRECQTAANRNRPLYKVQRGKKFYIDPISDAAYTATIYYYKYHPTDIAAILFDDDFLDCLVYAAIAAYLDSKGRHNKGAYYRALAQGKAQELQESDFEDKIHREIKYHDL